MIKVYHAPRTRSMRIIWLLEELGLEYAVETVVFKPVAGRLFAQQTPFGKVPAIEDGDFVLWETTAILEYLAARHPDGERLLPGAGTRAAGDTGARKAVTSSTGQGAATTRGRCPASVTSSAGVVLAS